MSVRAPTQRHGAKCPHTEAHHGRAREILHYPDAESADDEGERRHPTELIGVRLARAMHERSPHERPERHPRTDQQGLGDEGDKKKEEHGGEDARGGLRELPSTR